MSKYTCHTGGATGSDAYFEELSEKFGINIHAYSYQTLHHFSKHKTELSHQDFHEGKKEVEKANVTLKRLNIEKHIRLLARNWFQIKYATEIFAIGFLYQYKNKWQVKGGTAWAIEMAKNHQKTIFFFEQNQLQWYTYDYLLDDFVLFSEEVFISSKHFAGIGTRNLNLFGMEAINQLFENSFVRVPIKISS